MNRDWRWQMLRWITAAAALLPAAALANGGPVDWTSGLGTGGPRLGRSQQVRLVSEELSITVGDSLVEAEAVYRLENTGGPVEVDYAIPIESLKGYDLPQARRATVVLLEGGSRLPVETVVTEDSIPHPEGWTVPGRTTWHTTALAFDSAETITVTARVAMPPYYEDFATTKSFFPSWSARHFRWTLAPAGGWGGGVADSFSCRVDMRPVLRLGCEVDSVRGPGGWAGEGLWTVEESRFDMATAPPLELFWREDSLLLRRFVDSHVLRSQDIRAIRVSSILDDQGDFDYGPRNLLDGDHSTAWAEGGPGPGRGQGIEVELPEDFRLACVGIVNGYHRSPATLRDNARAAEVICGLVFREHFRGGRVDYHRVSLADPLEEAYDPHRLGPFQLLLDVGEPLPVRTLRIEVLDIHPGEVFEDLCISELVLLGTREGKP